MKEKSSKQVLRQHKEILKKITSHKKKAKDKGEEFFALSEDELLKKIMGETSNSPFFYSLSYYNTSGYSEEGYVRLYGSNPDDTDYHDTYISLFFGAGLIDRWTLLQELSTASREYNSPWQYQSSQRFSLLAHGYFNNYFRFSKPSEADVLQTTYFANCVLWQCPEISTSPHYPGRYFDRAAFRVSPMVVR